ncbi:hypothetical protein ScPMuIL_014364 [Solemya velum]
MIPDIHLFVQTLLYFVICITGFVISIPIGVNTINFQGICILYGDFEWVKDSQFKMLGSASLNCNFSIYLGVLGCILYGFGMGIYHAYALHKSRTDPTIGQQMWVMPIILLNSLIAVMVFIASCIISVGFSQFCSGLTDGNLYKSCADGQNKRWKNINTDDSFECGYYYRLITLAQMASWIVTLCWAVQVGLSILRFIRNRRTRSQGSDKENIGDVEPTA